MIPMSAALCGAFETHRAGGMRTVPQDLLNQMPSLAIGFALDDLDGNGGISLGAAKLVPQELWLTPGYSISWTWRPRGLPYCSTGSILAYISAGSTFKTTCLVGEIM